MRKAKISVRSLGAVKKSSDSASQMSRAVMGLRKMLLHGAFRPGERIAEIPLSQKLGVSRTPLRLAFEKLANEGLIKELPHSGFAANEFSVDYVWNAIEARGILEGAAARLAAERLEDSSQLEAMRSVCRAADEILKTDFENFGHRYIDLNEAFHSALVNLSGNQVLRRSIEQVNRLPFASPSALVLINKNQGASMELIPFAQQHHWGLIEAIENREGARAEALAHEHSRLSQRNLELVLANRSFLESIPGGFLIKFDRGM